MSEDSKQKIRSAQCARIILCFCKMHGVSIDEATGYDSFSSVLNKLLVEFGL